LHELSQEAVNMPDMQILGPIIGVAFAVIMIFVGIIVAKKAGGGGYMKKIHDKYAALAASLGVPPPQQQNGGYPVLRLTTESGANISIRPATYYSSQSSTGFSNINPRLLENPYEYEAKSDADRGKEAATQQVMSSVLSMAGRSSSYRARHMRTQASQITEVTLSLPSRFQDSRLLLTPETLMGGMTTMGEFAVGDPAFDKAFKVRGASESQVLSLLTPEVRQALLAFVNKHGKIQVHDRAVLWVHHGMDTSAVPGVVASMKELARALGPY